MTFARQFRISSSTTSLRNSWAQQQPTHIGRQVPDDLALMDVGRSQVHLGDHAWPTQTHVQPKAREGLVAATIFAKAGRVIKPATAVHSGELADRDRHTIHNRPRGVIEQETIADQTSQPFFHRPQVGSLPHKGRASHPRHFRKEVGIVAAEVVKDFLILAESQIRSHQFHRDDLAISVERQ